MFIEWTCVEDDGTRPYGNGISPDQRRPLRIVVGDEVVFEISVVNPVGGVRLLDPEADEFLVLDGRTLCLPSRPLFTVRSTPMAGERQRLVLTSDVTRKMVAQRGLFDLWAVRASGRHNLIPLSELVIAGSALGNNYL